MNHIPTVLKKHFSQQLDRIDQLQGRLNYQFDRKSLLIEALTHSSMARSLIVKESGEDLKWNERLEFLGDAVLGLCISSNLSKRPEQYPEGHLSRIRSSLVNEKTLEAIASSLGLGEALILSKGEENNGGRSKASLLADALEALIGAIFLDGGYQSANKVVEFLFTTYLAQDLHLLLKEDHKTRLQEITQKLNKQIPTYHVIQEKGPNHQTVFTVEVLFRGHSLGVGEGLSKKAASQAAAAKALDHPDLSSLLSTIINQKPGASLD